MPIIDLPKLGPVQFDDNLDDAELDKQIAHLEKKYEFTMPRAELTYGEMAGRAWERGKKQLGSTFGDIIPAMGASALGYDEYAKKQMEEAAATQREIQKYYKPQYGELADVKGISDVPGFVLETFMENVPNIATSLIPGIGAEVIAGRAALTAAGKNLVAQAAERGLAGEAAQSFVVDGMAKQAASIASKRAMGGNAGVFLGSYAQNAPEVFQNIYDKTGELAPGASMLFGAGSAALDSVLPASMLNSISGPLKVGIIDNLLGKSGMDKGVLRSITGNVMKSLGYEGLTEGAQEEISIMAENFVDKNAKIFDSPDWKRIIEASVRGAVAGGPFGVATGLADASKAANERRQKYNEVMANRQATLQERQAAKDAVIAAEQAEIDAYRKELSDAALGTEAEQDELNRLQQRTPLTEKERKIAANLERQRQKKQAAEVKADQERLKRFLKAKQGELDLSVPIEPSKIEPTPVEGQPDLFATPVAPTPSPEGTITEPTVVKKPEAPTVESHPAQLGSTKDELKALGKVLGIGPTARVLREDGPLAGMDLTNPEHAAQVKAVLEAYASGKPAAGAAEKIDAFLNRPEFQNVPSDREVITGRGEPSVPSPERVGEPVASGAEEVGAPVSGGLDTTEPVTGPAVQGEERVERPLTPKQQAKVEQGVADQNEAIAKNERHVADVLDQQLRDAAESEGIPIEEMRLGEHEGTDAYNVARLPGLIQQYVELENITHSIQEPKQRAKNVKQMEALRAAIGKSGKDAIQFLDNVRRNPAQLDALVSALHKHARDTFAGEVQNRVAEAKKSVEAKEEAKKAAPDYEAMAEDFKQRFEAKTGVKLWAPAYKGNDLNKNGRAFVEANNLGGLLDHLISRTQAPEIKRLLQKVRSLGLGTEIRIGEVPEGKAGYFDPATNTVVLSAENGLNEHTVIHEVTHAAISHVLRNPNSPLTKEFTKFFEGIQNQLMGAYGAENLQEFAAELMGNPEFQAVLKTIKAPRSGNLFQRIVQAIAEFFGFRKGQSAYEAGLKFVNDAIDMSADVEATPSDKMFLGVGAAVKDAFNAVGEIGQNMPYLSKRAADQTRNTFSNIREYGVIKTAMGLLRLDNINTIYGKELPSIQKLIDLLEQRTGKQEAAITAINTKYKRFMQIAKENPQAIKLLNDLAINARLAEVDLSQPHVKTNRGPVEEAKRQADYNRLKAQFDKLPASVQSVYKQIRQDYDAAAAEYQRIILDSVSGSLASKIKAELADKLRVIGYVPFLRYGDFWLEYADPDTGERAVSAFESVRERDQFAKQVLQPKGIDSKPYRQLQDIRVTRDTNFNSSSLIGRIIRDLQDNNASPEQIDAVYQAYLTMFPAQSIVKQFMKADNVLGMDRDIIRGYGDTMIKWTRKLFNSEYIPQIDNALAEIDAQAMESGKHDVYAAAENIRSQSAFFHNPSYNNLIHTATALSYFEYIAGNISSALVNITAIPLMVWPALMARYNFAAATSAITRAGKIALNMEQFAKNPEYTNLYKELMNHGQLEHTMAREILEGRRMRTEDYFGLKARIMDGISAPFAASEKYNRAVTAIAAYDLAKASGKTEAEAIREAINLVKEQHTSGMAATAPHYMQHPLGRVFFTFKSYAWNSAFVVARAFHQAFKGEDPEVRRIAQRQLMGVFGMAAAFGGVKGLPFYGLAETLGLMLNALFGDEDEPYDFNENNREFFGELGYKGAFNYLTNLELANRIQQDLLWRDDPRGVAENGMVMTAMKQFFGPAGSYLVNVGNAAKMMGEGHTERAIEAVMPSFVRNGMKGVRYMSEGALTLKGDPVDEDVNAWNGLTQVIGFSPADLSSRYETTAAAKSYEKDVLAKRQKLLNLYEMGTRSGDIDLTMEAREKIGGFNESHPEIAIDGAALNRSRAARQAAERNMINGYTFNKKLLPKIKDRFLDED